MGNLLGESAARPDNDGYWKTILFASRLSHRLVAAGTARFAHGRRALAELFWATVCTQSWGNLALQRGGTSSPQWDVATAATATAEGGAAGEGNAARPCVSHAFDEADVDTQWKVRPVSCESLSTLRSMARRGVDADGLWHDGPQGKLIHPFKIEKLAATDAHWADYLQTLYGEVGLDCRHLTRSAVAAERESAVTAASLQPEQPLAR